MLTEDGNVPEVNRQLLFEQNSFYLNTKGDAVHKPDKGPAPVKEKPQPEIEPAPPELEAWSSNHWTTREFPYLIYFQFILYIV